MFGVVNSKRRYWSYGSSIGIGCALKAKITDWWPFDGNLNNVIHNAPFAQWSTASAYQVGIKGQEIKIGSALFCTGLGTQTASGPRSFGFWVNIDVVDANSKGIIVGFNATAFGVGNTTQLARIDPIVATGLAQIAGGHNPTDGTAPITFVPPGRYFIRVNIDGANNDVSLYVNEVLIGIENGAGSSSTVGSVFYVHGISGSDDYNSTYAIDELWCSTTSMITEAEGAWLFNGTGRTASELTCIVPTLDGICGLLDAWWPMDGSLIDVHGGYHMSGTATYVDVPNTGKRADNSTLLVTSSIPPALNTKNWTVGGLFTVQSDVGQRFLASTNGAGTNYERVSFFRNAGGATYGAINATAPNVVQVAGLPTTVGVRFQLVMTYDGAFLKLYQNGELITSTACTKDIDAGAVRLDLGYSYGANYDTDHDEIFVAHGALSAAQVAGLWNGGQPVPYSGLLCGVSYGLVLWLKMDVPGTEFHDYSGTNKVMTPVGNTSIVASTGAYGEPTEYFDGSDTALISPQHDDFDFGAGLFKVQFTFKTSGVNPNNDVIAYIPDTGTFGGGIQTFEFLQGSLYPLYGKGEAVFGWGGAEHYLISPAAMSANTWYTVEFYRQADGYIRMFFNGVYQGSLYVGSNSLTAHANRYMKLGFALTPAQRYQFAGYIREVKIWKGTDVGDVRDVVSVFDPSVIAIPYLIVTDGSSFDYSSPSFNDVSWPKGKTWFDSDVSGATIIPTSSLVRVWTRSDLILTSTANVVIHYGADDYFSLWVNGVQLINDAPYSGTSTYTIPPANLVIGSNKIVVRLRDVGLGRAFLYWWITQT